MRSSIKDLCSSHTDKAGPVWWTSSIHVMQAGGSNDASLLTNMQELPAFRIRYWSSSSTTEAIHALQAFLHDSIIGRLAEILSVLYVCMVLYCFCMVLWVLSSDEGSQCTQLIDILYLAIVFGGKTGVGKTETCRTATSAVKSKVGFPFICQSRRVEKDCDSNFVDGYNAQDFHLLLSSPIPTLSYSCMFSRSHSID